MNIMQWKEYFHFIVNSARVMMSKIFHISTFHENTLLVALTHSLFV